MVYFVDKNAEGMILYFITCHQRKAKANLHFLSFNSTPSCKVFHVEKGVRMSREKL